jgi:glycosyltransferase involved in cell wall biosynthesis
MGNPLVSIIIPTYNRTNLLKRAIQSVLNQTYQYFEIIVVDDGSQEDVQQVLEYFRDDRIKYTRHEENRGLSAARNTGIRLSKGEYVSFLDSDDELLPDKLERQVKRSQELPNECAVIYSGFYYVSEKDKGKIVIKIVPKFRGDVSSRLLGSNITAVHTPIIKKKYLEKAGFFDEALSSYEDWDMWIRLSKHCWFDFVPDPLVKCYIHGDQMSTDLPVQIKARERILEKYKDDFSRHRTKLSFQLKRLAIFYLLTGNKKKAKELFLYSIRLNPLDFYLYIHILLLRLFPKLHKILIYKFSILVVDGIRLYY